jgi:hypothetical protein
MNKIKLLNIDKIISNNTILNDDYLIVQKFEDKISELYKTDNNSEIIDEDLSILYDITENNNYNIKIYSKPNLSLFNLEPELLDLNTKFVFGGSYIRSIFVENINIDFELELKLELELHLYPLFDIDFEQHFILKSYIETPTMFYKKVNNYIVYINKFKSKSIGEVLLNNSYSKRCIYHKERLYCSPMFILEYALNKEFISSDIVDPVFKTKIDLFGIFPKKIIKKDTIIDLINLKDYDSFKLKFIKNNFNYTLNHILNHTLNDIFDEETPIEYAIKLFINESCLVIREQIKLIILELFKIGNFIRHPGFYAELLNLSNIDKEFYLNLSDEDFIKIKSKQYNISISNISDINDFILRYYIESDLDEKFYGYINFLKKRLSGNIIDYLIRYRPEKIIKYGIKKKLFSKHHIYKIILESEELQHFLSFTKLYEIDIHMMMNYMDIIIKNSLSRSFYYIYKLDPSIISLKDDEENTILHRLSENNFNETFINLILTLEEDLLKKKNSLGETPLLMHARLQNFLIVKLLLQYIIHNELYIMLEDVDTNGNSIYHIIAKYDSEFNLLKLFINSPSTKILINKQNSSKQTPIMLSTIHRSENIFYLLQTANADLSIKDAYSNSVYHYICMNDMCIGMAIEDKPNIFGFNPSDYCKISKTYYHFI